MQNYQLSKKTFIDSHLNKLLSFVINLSPVLIYLSQHNIKETIKRIAEERVSDYGKWIDVTISYVENNPYGKINDLKGFDGLIRCIEDRKLIEVDIIKTLPIKTIIIENVDCNWENVWNKLEAHIFTL